jgi:rubrerythrin
MTRLLLGLAAIIVLGLMVRSALIAAMKDGKPGSGSGPRSGPAPRRDRKLPPDRLVCGVCGDAFDPEQTGWICPKCGK